MYKSREHLVVIIANNKNVDPKIYSCSENEKTKDEAVKAAKKAYENSTKNFEYESYYFLH